MDAVKHDVATFSLSESNSPNKIHYFQKYETCYFAVVQSRSIKLIIRNCNKVLVLIYIPFSISGQSIFLSLTLFFFQDLVLNLLLYLMLHGTNTVLVIFCSYTHLPCSKLPARTVWISPWFVQCRASLGAICLVQRCATSQVRLLECLAG